MTNPKITSRSFDTQAILTSANILTLAGYFLVIFDVIRQHEQSPCWRQGHKYPLRPAESYPLAREMVRADFVGAKS